MVMSWFTRSDRLAVEIPDLAHGRVEEERMAAAISEFVGFPLADEEEGQAAGPKPGTAAASK